VSAETLYNLQACEKVFCMIQTHLVVDGVAIIGSKRYYFGVGGGTSDLEGMVARDATLRWSVARSVEDGKSNIRDIILIRRLS
jgi:hypothetical protein